MSPIFKISSFYTTAYYSGNLNDIGNIGLNYYLVSSSNGNYPESSGEGILITVYRNYKSVGFQICYTQGKKLYYRGSWGGTNTFTAWKEL